MHVSSQSSLEFPASAPLRVRLEPWSLVRSGSQLATVNVSPWEIELPSITVTLPTVIVHLPTVVIDVFVVLRAPAAPGRRDDGSGEKHQGPKAQVRTDFGQLRVEVLPGIVTVTPTKVHAVPVTDQVRPLSVTVELDGLHLETHAEVIDVQLTGALEKR